MQLGKAITSYYHTLLDNDSTHAAGHAENRRNTDNNSRHEELIMLQHPLIRDGYDHVYHLLLAKKFEQWLRTHHCVEWSEIQANSWPLTRRQRRNLFELPFRFMRRHLEDGDYGLATNALQIYFDPLPPERPDVMMNYIAGPSGHEYVVLHDAKDPRQRLDWDRYRLGRYLALLERLAVRRLSTIWAQEMRRKQKEDALLFLDYGQIQVYRRYSLSGIRTFSPFEYTFLADLADANLEPSESRWIFDVRDLPAPPDNSKRSISVGSVTVEVGLTAPKEEQHRTIIKHAIDAGALQALPAMVCFWSKRRTSVATDQLIYSSGMSTPWGPAHYGTQYAQGLLSVGTAGHGGFMVTDKFLQRNIASERQRELIRSHGIEHYPRGRSTPRYCYEEDLDWAIVTLGVPHLWSRLFIVKPKEDNTLQPYMRSQPPTDVAERVTYLPEVEREAILQYLIKTLSATYPDFVEAMGYTPDPEGYRIYEERQERDRRREANDPDLIVTATKINDDETRVWTADGKEHIVTTDSYVSKHRKNWRLINLSDCDLIRHEEEGDTTS